MQQKYARVFEKNRGYNSEWQDVYFQFRSSSRHSSSLAQVSL